MPARSRFLRPLLLLAAPLWLAQQAVQAQQAGPGQPEGPPLPAAPPESAPLPPDLSRPPRPAESLPQPAIALPRGMEALPGGGWRLHGEAARGRPDAAGRAALAEIGRWLASRTEGRVTLLAQVAGPAEDASVARRDSLANGLALRQLLEAAGLDGTRIDVRPLGRTEEARDGIVLLPPGAASRGAAPASDRSANGDPGTNRQTQSQARP
ncbi:hypothetical protein CR162_03740 [Pseudoroseomonas rhizosphaerae]|uniref:OmpA-like domain-containing protein n=1 Tax=Teichococcus rhizosphaerae TaxID=1335062 RepID=A0A2C7AEF1_9PROT|nr:hypothetical protein [Pseudoroseomonas rhizosphaerae]PHK96449.1 hypothetical protein CR162_03740 [Pseudoroseomonas rhizosphaerae]